MPDDMSYQNKRGEQVFGYSIFKQLNLNAVMRSLLPTKPHISRRQRRIANGTLNKDGSPK